MSIVQQLMLSLFIAGCATAPVQKPQDAPQESSSTEQSIKEGQDDLSLDVRELFAHRFAANEYQMPIEQGSINQSTFTNNALNRYTFYQLTYENLALFLQPSANNSAILSHTLEAQSYDHARIMRSFFKQNSPMINSIEDARNWVRWLESFVYQADLLLRQEDALRLFQDRDRLIAGVNPFFYVEFDGRYYQLEYFTMQENHLWQKRITLSPQGEIYRWQQDQLSLERRGAF